jgi:hypothetical protein
MVLVYAGFDPGLTSCLSDANWLNDKLKLLGHKLAHVYYRPILRSPKSKLPLL